MDSFLGMNLTESRPSQPPWGSESAPRCAEQRKENLSTEGQRMCQERNADLKKRNARLRAPTARILRRAMN